MHRAMHRYRLAVFLFTLISAASPLQAQSLKGSRASMQSQNEAATRYGYSFLRTSTEVSNFVNQGYLVRVPEGNTLELHDVSYPYARPEVKLFLERLSAQYYSACNEAMTVTSLTRPMNGQPANASTDSVHPTGMAVDLRIPRKSRCRSWLEKTLLSLEDSSLLDVTRERNPPHYHVALYTREYESYVANLINGDSEYLVRNGDSLYVIAQRHDTTVAELKAANALTGNTIVPGQKLKLPGSFESTPPASTVAAVSNTAPATQTTLEDAASEQFTHVVRSGDSLSLIARRNSTTVEQLKHVNQLATDMLMPGQKLVIPGGTLVAVSTAALATTSSESVASPMPTRSHQVRRGDSLYEIAKRYDTTIMDLRLANSLNSDVLMPGQTLVIPGDDFTSGGFSEYSHTVRRGDTLWEIARRYGVTVNALRTQNGLASDTLQTGQVLRFTLQATASR